MHSVPGPACGSWALVIWLRSVPVRAVLMGGFQQWVRVGVWGNRAAHSPAPNSHSRGAQESRDGRPARWKSGPSPVPLTWCLLSVTPGGGSPPGRSPHPAGPCLLLPPEGGSFPLKQTLVKSLTKRFLSVFRNFGFGSRETREQPGLLLGGYTCPSQKRHGGAALQPWGAAGHCPEKSRHLARTPWPRAWPSKQDHTGGAASWGPSVRRAVTRCPDRALHTGWATSALRDIWHPEVGGGSQNGHARGLPCPADVRETGQVLLARGGQVLLPSPSSLRRMRSGVEV